MSWTNALPSELKFWDDWFKTKGLDWPQDYAERIDPTTEICQRVASYLKTGNELILDVGAGPLTVLGKMWKGERLSITACDALGSHYKSIMDKYGIAPIVETEQCKAEDLVLKYGMGEFDLVHAQNCIDHCEDPVRAIFEMVSVCRKGGTVLLRHEINEGKNENYQGLHQWDFYCDNNSFMISGKDSTVNMTRLLANEATVKTTCFGGYIENEITVY